MPDKPAALILCPESPYPVVGGGALRSAALVEYLSARYRLDAIVFRQAGARNPEDTRLAEVAHRILVLDLPPNRADTITRAARNLGRLLRGIPPLIDRFSGYDGKISGFAAGNRYDLAVIEHFWCAPYAAALAPAARRLALDLHNIESVLHEGCAAAEPWPLSLMHRQFHFVCAGLERNWIPKFHAVLAASPEDARRVQEIAPGVKSVVYPNTIPWVPPAARREEEVIAFSGNLEYHPNANGVRWFRSRVWPILRARFPRLIWRLIGKNPHAVRRIIAGDERIQVTGPVEDALTELAKVRVAVVPLLAGSGTRVKILEAWAAGAPVVSTPIGAEGLGAENGRHLHIAVSPDEFAETVATLLAEPELALSTAAAARELYAANFTWPAGWRRLEAAGF